MLNNFKFVAIFLGFCYYIINKEQRKQEEPYGYHNLPK